jgi:hypothetical protein
MNQPRFTSLMERFIVIHTLQKPYKFPQHGERSLFAVLNRNPLQVTFGTNMVLFSD